VTPDTECFTATAPALVQGQDRAKGRGDCDCLGGLLGALSSLPLQRGRRRLVETAAHKKVLVCGAIAITRMTTIPPDPDRRHAFCFGDGGGAVLIGAMRRGRDRLSSTFGNEIDGSGAAALNMPAAAA